MEDYADITTIHLASIHHVLAELADVVQRFDEAEESVRNSEQFKKAADMASDAYVLLDHALAVLDPNYTAEDGYDGSLE